MYNDLFEQAIALATLDRRRPKQANLRRAISSTYYAVFHFLIDNVCCIQLGAQHAQKAYRNVLARGFSHSVMSQACLSFRGGTLKAAVAKGLPANSSHGYTIPSPIRDVAAIFIELQEKRHFADYDLSEQFNRLEVLTLVEAARVRVERFQSLPADNDKRFFLACLWAWKELAHR